MGFSETITELPFLKNYKKLFPFLRHDVELEDSFLQKSSIPSRRWDGVMGNGVGSCVPLKLGGEWGWVSDKSWSIVFKEKMSSSHC